MLENTPTYYVKLQSHNARQSILRLGFQILYEINYAKLINDTFASNNCQV